MDAVRGVGILLMGVWHSVDAWLRPALQRGTAWRGLRIAAGIGSPIFFILLGTALALRDRSLANGGAAPAERLRRLVARGLELVALGYLLRVQLWALDNGGLVQPGAALTATLLVVALVGIWLGVRRLGAHVEESLLPLVIAAIALPLAVRAAAALPELHKAQLLRVDVLQSLGAAAVAAALIRYAAPVVARPGAALLAASVVAALTNPLARAVGAAPGPWLTHYLVRLPPVLRSSRPARFPLAPWLSLVLAGTALAPLLRAAARAHPLRRALAGAALLLGGAVLVLLTAEQWPVVYATLEAHPALVQPARMLFRLGAIAALLGLAQLVAEHAGRLLVPLVTFGRGSLFLYWFHLELVFGRPAGPLRRSLGWGEWLALALVLLAVMYLAALLWARAQQLGGRALPALLLRLKSIREPVRGSVVD